MKRPLCQLAAALFLAHLRRTLALLRVADNLLPGGGIPSPHGDVACLPSRRQSRTEFAQVDAPFEWNWFARWLWRLEVKRVPLDEEQVAEGVGALPQKCQV